MFNFEQANQKYNELEARLVKLEKDFRDFVSGYRWEPITSEEKEKND